MRRERDSLKNGMLELMARPEGMTAKDMQSILAPELEAQGISARIGKACRNGWCFAAPKSVPRRYFDSQDRAYAFVPGPGGISQRQEEEGRQRRAAILAHVQRDGGASTPELKAAVGIQASACSSHLTILRKAGEVYSGTVGHGQGMGKVVRHFGTRAERDAWIARNKKPKAPRTYVSKASKAPNKPAQAPIRGEVVTPEGVVIQRAPVGPGRYEVPADFRGAFSLAGIGRDVQTGQAWQ